MNEIMIFTDGSVDTHSKIGYGACLHVPEPEWDQPVSALKPHVKLKRFDRTSSTKLELQTVIWALKEIQAMGCKIWVYTDSQNIISLEKRREHLILSDFRSKKNKPLNHAELYREFFKVTDTLDCTFIKVRGHQPSSTKDRIHQLFTLVDRASRRALRDVV